LPGMLAMNDTPSTPHQPRQRVRCVFADEREGVVIESNSRSTLIEFEDEEGGKSYTHQKWLPTRHWVAIPAINQNEGGK